MFLIHACDYEEISSHVFLNYFVCLFWKDTMQIEFERSYNLHKSLVPRTISKTQLTKLTFFRTTPNNLDYNTQHILIYLKEEIECVQDA